MRAKIFFFNCFIVLGMMQGCSMERAQKIIVSFERTPMLEKEKEFLNHVSEYTSNTKLQKYLNSQTWIETFLVKRYAFAPLEIYIKSKKPQYIWKKQFYLDKELSKFLYDGGSDELIHLEMPIEHVKTWVNAQDRFQRLLQNSNIHILSVNYTVAEGWYLITNKNLRINIGDELSEEVYEKLSLTLKYMFENNLTPSIMDLRYKDGAALNYGK